MSAQPQPSAPTFVPLGAGDLDAVLRIEHRAYPFPWTRGNFQDSFTAGHSAWGLWSAAGELIGYAVVMIAADEAHLLNLTVNPAFQGGGHGWQLLDGMARRACEHGARTMLLEVRPSNAAALRLYQRYGFQRIGVRRDYYPAGSGRREHAVVMSLALVGRTHALD